MESSTDNDFTKAKNNNNKNLYIFHFITDYGKGLIYRSVIWTC